LLINLSINRSKHFFGEQVYIVEDLQRGYAPPPKMDPVHEQRLKMLQLM
jgi:hypothetical protein